ncbi:MAG: MBG domain-containing protein [Bacteroidales bacterium]
MKKTLLLNAFVVLLLALTVQAMGQYTGSYPNVAISKLVVATDSMDAHKPRLAVDDDLLTYASIPGAAPGWLMINLGGYYYVDGFGFVLPNGGELVNDFIFQVSEDGDAWTDVTTETIAGTGTYNYTIAETDPVGFVRIYMTDKDANASFSEVYVYGSELPVPAAPNALAATNITASSFRANWASVALADGYVYTVAYDAAFTQYVPGYEGIWVGAATTATVTGLAPGTTYHFKARAFNLSGSSNWGLRQTATTLQGTQTITFGALDAVDYGDAAFDLTATASSGLAVSYTSSDVSVATVSGSTVTIVGPGTTDITASQGGNAQYTAAVPVVQDLVVNRAPLGVALAVAEDKVYDGNTDAVIVGATLDGLVGDDDVTLTGATSGVFAQTGVGTDIVVTVSMDIAGGDVAKYIFTAPGGFVADIQPKELIVTAEDKSREECAANPSLTFTYDGFVGDEDESALTTEPVPATTATDGSADGDYDITLSGGVADNYSFTYVSGTLTVTPDVTMPVLITRNATVLLDANDMGCPCS